MTGITEALAQLTAQKRLTAVDLAAILNCTEGYLARVMKGEVAVTRLMVEGLVSHFPELDGDSWHVMALMQRIGGCELAHYLAEIPAERLHDAEHLLGQLLRLRRA